jgi:WD40 repeat protein
MKKSALLLLLGLLVFLIACGGSGGNSGGNNATPVKLNMTTASSLVGQNTQFSANIPVSWTVKEHNGGTITSAGLYTAPPNTGVFHVIATSKADTTQSTSAAVNISASFLTLQQVIGGATRYFMTPLLTTLDANGRQETKVVADLQTGNPVQGNMLDLVLSPDGAKAALTAYTAAAPDSNGEVYYYWNIAIADVTSQQITLLTHNENGTGGWLADMYPQFSPDNKTLIFNHYGNGYDGPRYNVRTMNVDGSNVQTIWSADQEIIWSPSYSPDGKKIVGEHAGGEEVWYDGVAVMNADGTNLVQLTGYDQVQAPCWGWDETPQFTPDGKQIIFTRVCFPDSGGVMGGLYLMNADGSNVQPIKDAATPGIMSCEPHFFANGVIAFASNHDIPGTNAFDIYTAKLDGTNLTRLTNNMLFDSFSAVWMNYFDQPMVSRQMQGHSALEQRLLHKRMSREHRILTK